MAPLSHEETSGSDLDGASLFSCGGSSLGVKVILQKLVTLEGNSWNGFTDGKNFNDEKKNIRNIYILNNKIEKILYDTWEENVGVN